MELLARVRWDNVLKAALVLGAVALVLLWPRLAPAEPELPPAAVIPAPALAPELPVTTDPAASATGSTGPSGTSDASEPLSAYRAQPPKRRRAIPRRPSRSGSRSRTQSKPKPKSAKRPRPTNAAPARVARQASAPQPVPAPAPTTPPPAPAPVRAPPAPPPAPQDQFGTAGSRFGASSDAFGGG